MADLELHGIRKTFPGVTVLQDVSLRVTDGEFTILLGPSGCGKSTLLRIIAGLERQTAGSVRIGQEVVDARSPGDRDIAMVFQHYALYPHFTVRENLAFGLKMRKVSRDLIDERIREAAQLLDIEPLLNRKPKELSGGQRQRVAMGRAIVRKPKLFLFDEPLSNLDARLRATMRVELKKLHQRLRATIIYVTHDQVEAMTLGDKIVIMDRGRIRQVDSPAQVYAKPADPFVAAFVGTPGMNLLEGALVREAAGWSFVSEEIRIPLPRLAGSPPEQPGNQVVFGMRPEDIRLTPSEGTESQLKAEVEVVEDLGAELVLHVSAGRHHLVVRTSPDERVRSGDGLDLHLPHDRMHLFYTDHRIELVAPTVKA